MTNAQSPETYMGRTAVDAQGNKIGSVGQVYVNDTTGVAGLGHREYWPVRHEENFAPLYGSTFSGDDLVLPFDKDVVKDAPDVADSDHIDVEEQQALYCLLPAVPGRHGGPERNGLGIPGRRTGPTASPAFATQRGQPAQRAMTPRVPPLTTR